MTCGCDTSREGWWKFCPSCGKNYDINDKRGDDLLDILDSLPASSIDNLIYVIQKLSLRNEQNDLIDDHGHNSDDFILEPWIPIVDDDGDTYYYNEETKETTWDQPIEKIISSEHVLSEDSEDLTKMTVVQLKEQLKELGLSTVGNKKTLIDRLSDVEMLDSKTTNDKRIYSPDGLSYWDGMEWVSQNEITSSGQRDLNHFLPEVLPKPDTKIIRDSRRKNNLKMTNKNQINLKMIASIFVIILMSALIIDTQNEPGEGIIDGIISSTSDDADGDGLTDTREWDIGTDSTKADSDGDGLDDGTEVNMGTDPLNPDTDYDGYRDNIDLWPLSDWALEVTWSGWEVEDNEVCEASGSKAMRWTVSGVSGEHSFDDSGSGSGIFYFDMPDDNENEVKSITFTVDATYTNCPLSNQAQLFYGFTCLTCSDPGPAGASYATYQFNGIDTNYESTQSITGSRSSDDFRAEGWLSSSRINLKSVFL